MLQSQHSKLIFVVSDFTFFPIMFFETAEFWCIVSLTANLRLLQMKTPIFFNI